MQPRIELRINIGAPTRLLIADAVAVRHIDDEGKASFEEIDHPNCKENLLTICL
ncbi:hypothetical protein M595_1007 [Lyngbya aestuarii BL J]|uniref:Uncharacterized protein n=1 Tax=Lyngbya aestuarii BL J TaxID=1348334 RepID=U7QM13_9CYAN|nr:hypothetical protein [Lyngbya aestuarii]ERT09004.1 hypothetical protein M595_1007 [Lyngbya aestuarii BL J]